MQKIIKPTTVRLIEQGLFLLLISALTAAFSTAFLVTLNYFFSLFTENLYFVFILPLLGVMTLWLYNQSSSRFSTMHLNFEGIRDYRAENAKNLGLVSALVVFCSASLSQLFGASTGREGAAVQYGASLGFAVTNIQRLIFKRRDYDLLVRAGIVAGFSSLFGTPLAALIFLGEKFGFKQNWHQSLQWAAASYLSFYFSKLLNAPHSIYPQWPNFSLNSSTLSSLAILLLVISFCAVLYKKIISSIDDFRLKFKIHSYYFIFFAGIALAAMTWAVRNSKYNGTGALLIQESFATISSWTDPFLKIIFTVISIVAGFKGGEVTPLMAIGATLGSFLSPLLELPLVASSAIGCIFLFAVTLRIPLTGAFLMIDLFGTSSAAIALSYGFIFSIFGILKGAWNPFKNRL